MGLQGPDTPDAAAHPAAALVFGAEVGRAAAYARLLATKGIEWGLVGPREVDRIWERHVLNSVAVGSAIGPDASVVDVGSGAGLPGIPLALARPDLRVTLLEPLLRRATFLTEVVDELGLGDRVSVVRGRAVPAGDKDPWGHHARYDAVTSRAVAGLPRLLAWCAPLLSNRGTLVALKGSAAEAEVAEASAELERHRLVAEVRTVVPYPGAEPTALVVCRRRA